ncbi:hypothetical protein [Candidatus Avelusimicrobium aviculae]|uniref:hypothetical protein n=1 Tax=Candidatus Avelusimicrobium aviculae TaxID=3416206 RepID=UPI003D096C28
METEDTQIFKIRFKLPSGEEFEAQGPKDFIEEQRAYFLNLTGKKPTQGEGKRLYSSVSPLPKPETPVQPAPRQRPTYPIYPAKQTPIPQEANFPTGLQPTVIPASGGGFAPEVPLNQEGVASLWEKLFKVEEGALVLRRKSRLLTPQTAALVLIAAARVLRKENEYSALHLSKSLRKSGYGEGRLDRLLLSEMRAGSIESAGSKRSRAYKLSSEGFARAIVLAEKIAEDL